MKRILCVALVGTALVLAFNEGANAQGRRFWRWRGPFAGQRSRPVPQPRYQPNQYHPRQPVRRYNPNDYYEDLYPKFYGGFHSRHFTEYGYPPGDIGLRGMPW